MRARACAREAARARVCAREFAVLLFARQCRVRACERICVVRACVVIGVCLSLRSRLRVRGCERTSARANERCCWRASGCHMPESVVCVHLWVCEAVSAPVDVPQLLEAEDQLGGRAVHAVAWRETGLGWEGGRG